MKMATKTFIKIEIECEDITDFKSHMSMIRENVVAIMKLPKEMSTLIEPLSYEGMNSSHKITLTRE